MSPLEPAVPVLDNSATRGDLVALRTLAEAHHRRDPSSAHDAGEATGRCVLGSLVQVVVPPVSPAIDRGGIVRESAQLGRAARNGIRTVATGSRERGSMTLSTLAPES